MAVRVFHEAKDDGTCSKEESSKYTQICDRIKETQLKEPGTFEDNIMYKFEDLRTIQERVNPLYGRVKRLCAAAFELNMEDIEGTCDAEGAPFPRLWAIQNALIKESAAKKTTPRTTKSQPPEEEITTTAKATDVPTLKPSGTNTALQFPVGGLVSMSVTAYL
ncbi:uncharacterized protein LOC144153309 [Haemaphysalis longicornis]